MTKTALITGGGSGVGQALAIALAEIGLNVFIVGRRQNKLENTKQYSPNHITAIAADIGTTEGRSTIAKIVAKKPLHYLVHNAAIVEPLVIIDKITLTDLQKNMAINLEGPLFLTQLLLPNFVDGSRILHISSGLAHRAFAGSAAYSLSKAAFHMLYQVWNEELSNRGILAGSVQPGVVDTEMQAVLRSDTQFVNRNYFENLKIDNKLLSPQRVAKALCHMLLKMDVDRFTEKDWRVEELLTQFKL